MIGENEHVPVALHARPDAVPAAQQGAPAAEPVMSAVAHAPANVSRPNEFLRAFEAFRASYPDFAAGDVTGALMGVWARHGPRAGLDIPGHVEEAFATLVAEKFAQPVTIESDDDGLDIDIENMRAAMEASQQTYELEKAAAREPTKALHDMTEEEVAKSFPSSEMVPVLQKEELWSAFVATTHRKLAHDVLKYEQSCRKWWRQEPGVSAYFTKVCEEALPLLRANESTADQSPASTAPKTPTPQPASPRASSSAAGQPSSSSRKRSCEEAAPSDAPPSKKGSYSTEFEEFLRGKVSEIEDHVLLKMSSGCAVPALFADLRPVGSLPGICSGAVDLTDND